MAIKARPNGEPDTMLIHIGWIETFIVTALGVLLAAGVTTTIFTWSDVRILKAKMDEHVVWGTAKANTMDAEIKSLDDRVQRLEDEQSLPHRTRTGG